MRAFVFFNSHFSANITERIDTYIDLNILTDFSVSMAVIEQFLRSNLQKIDSVNISTDVSLNMSQT